VKGELCERSRDGCIVIVKWSAFRDDVVRRSSVFAKVRSLQLTLKSSSQDYIRILSYA